MSTRFQPRSESQKKLAAELGQQLHIDPDRILFFPEPWLPPEALTAIARQSDKIKTLDEGYQEFIPSLNQVAHHATVIDYKGRTWGRSGIATVDEHAEVDAHVLAAGRCISAALTSAGVNPLRPGSIVELSELPSPEPLDGDEVANKNKELRQIHLIATQKGLIKIIEVPGEKPRRDYTEYRMRLGQWFKGVTTAAGFDHLQRQSVIEALNRLPDVDEFAGLIDEESEAS